MPADHKIFNQINSAQWLWYLYNYIKDKEEEFEQRRDLVEYHASFIEPEAVRKIRESRERAVEVSDDDFARGLEYIFGRTAPGKSKSGKIEARDPTKIISEYNSAKSSINNMGKQNKAKHWMSFDLE